MIHAIVSLRAVAPFLLIGLLGGCVAHAPPLLRGAQVVLPSKVTSGLNPGQATDLVLKEAARITLDHGYRYFVILPVGGGAPQGPAFAVTPGTPIQIDLLKTKRNGAGHVWDAYSILRNHSLAR